MKEKKRFAVDEYYLKKIEELASMCHSKADIAAFFGVDFKYYLKKEAANPAMSMAFDFGFRKMTGNLAKKALNIAYKSDDKNALQAIKFILTSKDYTNWSEKYQEKIHGIEQIEDAPKINFIFSFFLI